ncbi:MAG: hypothetical protein EHM72_11110, partial [Calditrichaeota bacterium]
MKTLTKIIFSVSLTFLLACSREEMPPVPPTTAHPMISVFTSGFMSRSSAVRVVFVADMIDSSRINSIVEPSPFSFTPRIKGETTWRDRRTLQFHPAEWLPPGTFYTGELNLKKIIAEGIGEDHFQFTFSTILPTMEISVDGLSPMDIADAAVQRLSGRLEFSDVMVLQDVEKIVTAEYDHRPMEIIWASQDERVFTFFIDNLVREKREKDLKIRWDGRALDIAERGEREIKIPSLADFSVTQVRAIRRDQQFVEIRFSDPLQKPQSLEGLIQVSDYTDLHYTIDNNIIRAYSNMLFMGDLIVTVHSGILNQNGFRLQENSVHQVTFDQLKPSVAFVGNGIILPTTQGLTIPIETVNVRSVLITAIRISEEKIPQFLQVNNYDGDRELHRVGREVWKQIVDLGVQPTDKNQTKRFGLDVTPLVTSRPPGLYRLDLTFRRPFILYDCDDKTADQPIDLDLASWDDEDDYDYWPMGDQDFDWNEFYNQRDNPCHPAFYYPWWDHDVTVSKNILISDIGLIAKKGENNALLVAVTDLKSAEPMANVSLSAYDFQQTQIGVAKSNAEGFAEITCSRKPFLLVAEQGDQSSYLKLNEGSALSISHFDVGGEAVPQGIKGFIYGERGVWRPGDAIFLTFILFDDNKLPPHHPVSIEFYNPRGQQVLTQTQTHSINGFYTFRLNTAVDAPTGNWRAKCIVGGVTFEKIIKIESIMPNRLSIDLDFGGKTELSAEPMTGNLSASWLFGAKADNLIARVEGRLTPIETRFESLPKYTFDDPLSTFEPESFAVFDGALDHDGKARIALNVGSSIAPPGKVNAVFNTRVFEPGGAFSSHRLSMPMSPYDHYIGLSLPIKDPDNPTLATDSTHIVSIARVTPSGKAEGNGFVELSLYKIKWRWWWEKEKESLAEYLSAESYRPVQSAVVPLRNGMGQWNLRLPESEWGRYLVRIKDKNGRHCSGAIVYVDVPGWEGRGRKDSADGAGILVFSSDKTQYNVGETVTLSIPAGKG